MSKIPVFVHTEKTAGGAVAEYFGFEKGVKTPREDACVDVTYYGQHGKQIRNFLKSEDDRVLITLRDPADRAISAYNWKKNKTGRDYHKDLDRVIAEGSNGPAPVQNFTVDDYPKFNNLRLKPYKHYFEGLELDDPRIKVLCTNDNFSESLSTYAKDDLSCAFLPDQVPVIHKATNDETTLSDDLRNKIYENRSEDKAIFDHFCA